MTGTVGPECAPGFPQRAKASFVADRVLHDECAQPFGSAQRQEHANAPAVVLHRERVAGEADFVSELLNDLGEVVERVAEAIRRRCVARVGKFPADSQHAPRRGDPAGTTIA